MQSVESGENERLLERLARFARLHPDNPQANFYYAVSLWKQRERADNAMRVESLLSKAVLLDPRFAEAYLQLGNFYADRGDKSRSLAAYEKAVQANAGLEEAHYRMAQIYERTGDKFKAQQELEFYRQISKKKEADIDHQRRQVQEFVYTLRNPSVPPK
jgi:tetratricopeptide (TPR) repeat protein